MTDPKKLLAALAAIPPVALDDFLTETRRKAEAERKAEEARRKQAEADARSEGIASLRELAKAAREREHERRMAESPAEVAAEDERRRKAEESARAHLDRLVAGGNPAT